MTQPVFWVTQVDPASLILIAGPTPDGPAFTVDDAAFQNILHRRGNLVRIELQGDFYDIAFSEHPRDRALGAVIVFDDLFADRLTALSRFWDAVRGRGSAADPRITPPRLQRARLMLRVVDARIAGATHRQIAEVLFPNHHHDPAKWVESPFRVMMNRLVRDGMASVRGGYRKLLRRPRRSRKASKISS